MKVHAQTLFLTVATSALLVAAGSLVMGGKAQAADMPVKAPSTAEAVANAWWFHGYVEVGGRFFANDPEKSGIAARGGRSLGKFYEYRDLRPGAFGNFHLATGTNNGLYQIDVWGKNVGYDDQRYDLSASKAGELYFNFQWDETPHNYGTGHTIYNGVGTTALTLPAGLSNQLHNDCLIAPGCAVATQNAAVKRDVENNLHDVDMGIQRDTASVNWRWTPTMAWDVRADYSNTHRTGTQTDGVTLSWGTSGVRVDAPKPVDDTTQNFGMNGEYQGTSPWGKLFTFKVAYTGSVYTDHDSSYTIQNPFCATGATTCDANSAPMGMMSLWPSNHSNGVSGTLAADLPAQSRYMGTASYVMMRQNENFLPFTINPNLGNDPVNGQPWTSTAALPASSLNGEINTFLSNNVLTTKLTSDLESKLSYRYYRFDNQTPEILVPMWIGADFNQATPPATVSPSSTSYRNVQSIAISYTKQNAGAQLNWRPDKHWNLGAAYGYERYDWTRADVDVTNENSGKVFADWKPIVWATARASWEFGARRYDNYDYLGNVGNAQWQNGGNTRYSTAYRQFYLDNRDRNKARFSLAMDLFHNFTVTPNFGLLNDEYKLNQATEVGLLHNHAWNAGVDVAYTLSPATRFMFSYLYEHRSQLVSSGTPGVTTGNSQYYTADVEDKVNTFVFSVDHAIIPDKLDVHLGYTTALATNSQPVNFSGGALLSNMVNSGGQIPDVKSAFQRLEATAKYTFDEDFVRGLGWKGKVFAKLGYAWERNAVANWQIDNIQPYMGGAPYCTTNLTSYGCGYMLWLANDNPNYNVHMVKASLGFKW